MQSRRKIVLAVLLAVVACFSMAYAGSQTIAYPTAEETSFTITAPDDWTLTQAESDGDYFYLEAESGAQLAFRTLPAKTEKQVGKVVEKAATEIATYLMENYDEVEIGEAQDDTISGCTGAYATGSGKDKESGDAMGFGFGWYVLPDDKVVEIWFAVTAGDDDGAKQAEKILRSFAVP